MCIARWRFDVFPWPADGLINILDIQRFFSRAFADCPG